MEKQILRFINNSYETNLCRSKTLDYISRDSRLMLAGTPAILTDVFLRTY
jgi:hypothetical protein